MEYRIKLPFYISHSNAKHNYLSIPVSLVKPLCSTFNYVLPTHSPNLELILSANSKSIVINILNVNSKQKGLVGSESILESLGLTPGTHTDFIFKSIDVSFIIDEVTFMLLNDNVYDPVWLSKLYNNDSSFRESPENLLKLTFLESIVFDGNIFKILFMGKPATIKAECDKEIPIRIADSTKLIFKLPNQVSAPKVLYHSVSDIYGMGHLIDFLKWRVFVPLAYREYHEDNKIKPPRGVLLWGPPGCGKSHIAKYFYDLHLSTSYVQYLYVDRLKSHQVIPPQVIVVSATDLLSNLPSKTLFNIKNLFKVDFNASKVVFIDEIHCIASKRGHNSNVHLLMTLLTEMDSCVISNQGVVIIGLTNRPNDLDPAIRRPGRFDSEFHLGVPNSSQRYDIFKGLMMDINHNLTDKELKDVSDQTSAFVASDLNGLIQKSLSNKSQAYLEGKAEDTILTYKDLIETRKTLSPSGLREIYVEIPHTLWSDIGGYEDVKLLLKQSVEWPFTNRNLFSEFNIKAPKGILLYGPPGCSKTMMAKAVATSSHMNFISIKGPELFSKWVGESERSIRQVFFIARSNAPCVIFFDEIDSIGKSRQSEHNSEVGNRVLSQLLNEMDGINSIDELVIIGATNRPDVLDPALLRPGRFDRLIYVTLPDIESRKKILEINLTKLSIDPSIDLETLINDLSERSNGFTGAEIECFCREAALRSISKYISSGDTDDSITKHPKIHVKMEDIEESINSVHYTNLDQLLEIYKNFNT